MSETLAKAHWPAIDGLRAVSIALVLCVHLQLLHMQGGLVGVDVFFVLSGFLITALLIDEWDRHAAVSLRNFYVRRALRLFPALLLTIVVALIVIDLGLSYGYQDRTLTGLPWVVLYVGDIARAIASPIELGLLGPTWSLAVEEQFYLIWPSVFLFIVWRKWPRQRVSIALALVAFAEMAYRIALIHGGAALQRVSYAPDTRSDGLLLGCAVAFWLSSRPARPVRATAARLLQLYVIGGVLLSAYVVHGSAEAIPKTFEVGIPIAVMTASAIVLTVFVAPIRPLTWLLSLPPLVWLGRRSYGLYLLHYPIFVATRADVGSDSHRIVGVVLSVVAAALSYEFWERPWLQRKKKFQRSEVRPRPDRVA